MTDWNQRIDNVTERVVSHFSDLTMEELNWKPDPDTWSIAQNLDHLITINESYFPILADLRLGKFEPPLMGKFGFMVSLFGKTILKSVQPDRKKKIKTFPIWEPRSSQIPADIVEKFKQHQAELKQQIDNSKKLIKQGAIISSPANKNIVYKLETAFQIIITHEQRHLVQAMENLGKLQREESVVLS